MVAGPKISHIQLLPEATTPRGEVCSVLCRIPRVLAALRAELLVRADGGESAAYPLRWVGLWRNCDVYEGRISAGTTGLFWLCCRVHGADGTVYVGRGGRPSARDDADPEQWTVYDAGYHTPAWFAQGVCYQIFVDRFHRPGAFLPKEDGRPRLLHADWNEDPVVNERPTDMLNNDFFGGNLAGIRRKLPYLKGLGVGTLYLTPIFDAASNHKYDTGDYHSVDAMFGDEEELRRLCADAAGQGMRVILDAVFSHTGIDSVYFNAYGRYPSLGAAQSKDSPYFDWYTFTHWPDQYHCWWDVYTLPTVNKTDAGYLDFISNAQNSVVRRWLRAGVAGFRLDVADELPQEFIEPLRRAVKQTDADALLLGEVWEDASNKVSYAKRRQYFWGSELDGVMNYPARDALIAFVKGEMPACQCRDTLAQLYAHYPRPTWRAMLNLLGSHDTARILNVLGCQDAFFTLGRMEKYAYRMSDAEVRRGKERLKMAAMALYMLPGSPCVYYGDEAGLQGSQDPMNRRTYPWGRQDGELLAWYRQLGALKTRQKALHDGDFTLLADGPDVLVVRRIGEQAVTAVLNRRRQPYFYRADALGEVLVGSARAQDGGLLVAGHSAAAFTEG
ncbi:MAG: glycoside hydrolase family 13 protein [Eubacteriales bacterium]|nr:glycoside hydrolase family 13 protein [Eubacteriales bacterium]